MRNLLYVVVGLLGFSIQAQNSLSNDDLNRIANANKSPVTRIYEGSGDYLGVVRKSVLSGSDIGRPVINTVNSATEDDEIVFIIDTDTGSINDAWVFRTAHPQATISIQAINGITINSALTQEADGVSITGLDHYIYLRKTASNTYFASSDALLPYTAPIPENIYLEASAVNAGNPNNTYGSWSRETQNDPTKNLSITTETPAGSAISTSIRINKNDLGDYGRLELDLVSAGISFTVGQLYELSFDYRRVSGDTNGQGLRVRILNNGTQEFHTITNAATGNWERASFTFTTGLLQPTIWIVPSWDVTADDDFYFTNFSIIEIP